MYSFKNGDQLQFKEAWDLFEEVRSYDGKKLSEEIEDESSEECKLAHGSTEYQ